MLQLSGEYKAKPCYAPTTAVGFQEKRWRVTLYKRTLQPDGRAADVEEVFEDVKPKYPASEIVDARGRLAFVTASGKGSAERQRGVRGEGDVGLT